MINPLSSMKNYDWTKIVFAVILLVLGTISPAHATDESHIQTKTGKIQAGDSCNVVDDKFVNLPSGQWDLLNNVSVTNIISFEIRNDTSINYYNKPFTCTLNVSIRYFSARDQLTASEINNINLIVKYDTAKGAYVTNEGQYKFQNAYRVNVVVNSISSSELGSDLPAIFRIKNQILIKRYYPFSPSSTSAISASLDGSGAGGGIAGRLSSGISNSKVVVTWVPSDFTTFPGGFGMPDEYDVEWIYVDKNSERATQIGTAPYSSITDAIAAQWMRHDNTRTTVAGDMYQIPLTYPDGYILVRVRGVMYQAGTNLRLTGAWQYRDGNSVINCVEIPVHEENLNWQSTASFAEGGKRKDVVTYFDGSLKSRQAVTVNNADNVAVVAETMYDKMGRPAMNILPSPVVDKSGTPGDSYDFRLKYYPAVNKNESGNPYSYLDISTSNSCETAAQTLDPTDGAALYYSANNPAANFNNYPNFFFTKNVPDASHGSKYYPFSLTEYMADNTGRIRRQGGVGYEFRIGGGHETQYFYGKPTPRSLYRLFGAEVGNASHYLKNMVIDANGQASISYVNASGKTIATALAGSAPPMLDPLASSQSPESNVRLDEILIRPQDMQVDAGSLKMEATATFLAAVRGDFTLRYSVNPAALITPYGSNQQVCNNCSYNLLVEVKDDCGTLVAPEMSTIVAVFTGNDITCYTDREPFTGTLLANDLDPGQYTVTYRLQLSEQVINYQVDQYIANNSDLKKLRQFFMEELYKLDLAGCYNECTNCAEKLGTLSSFTSDIKAIVRALQQEKFADYAAVFDIDQEPLKTEIEAWITTTYNTLSANCTAISASCAPLSPCEEKLERMKQDVRPGGQYALFTYNESTGVYALVNDGTNLLGLYNTPPGSDPDLQAIYNISYVNAQGSTTLARTLTLEEFILAYMQHPEWADLFVKKHVEYCNYLFCTGYASSSYGFDETLREYVKDGDDAVTKNLYSRSNYKLILDGNKDPFFATGGTGASYLTDMNADLLNASDVLGMTIKNSSGPLATKNILQLVDWMLYCKPTSPTATEADFVNSWSCTPDPNCRSLSQEWEIYRDLYLRLKTKYVQLRKEALSPDCKNCFIGADPAQSVACASSTSGSGSNNCPSVYDFYLSQVEIASEPQPVACNPYSWAEYVNMIHGPQSTSVTIQLRVNILEQGTQIWFYNTAITFDPGETSKKVGEFTNLNPPGIIDPNEETCINVQYQIEILNQAPECTGGTSMLSSCPSDPRAISYANKTRIWDEYINYEGYQQCQVNSTPPTNNTDLAGLRTQATATLNDLSSAWLDRLRSVVAQENELDDLNGVTRRFGSLADPDEQTPNSTLVNLVAALKIIAQKNIDYQTDIDKIFAASVLPTGITASNGYNNFSQAFNAIIGSTLVQKGFGPELLDQPYPWDKRPVAANYNSNTIDNTLCTKINAVYSHYASIAGGSASEAGFAAYLADKLGGDFLFSAAELQELRTRCTNGCKWLEKPMILPAVFSPNPGNGDVSWIDCGAVSGLKSSFDALYPNIAADTRLYRVSLANYINHQIGFALSYEDYMEFIQTTCAANTNAVLYTRPIASALLADEMACTRNLLAGAFESSHQEYVRYIEIVRLETRNRYIATCLANQTTVKLEGDQYEYHYTLYYYDQSGNLVKTVPPEGVRLLTPEQVDQVEMFVDATVSCDGIGIPTAENATATFNGLSSALQTNTGRSVEMWLYSATGSSDRQFRIVTPDNKYMYQAAIKGDRLWVEMYSLLPEMNGISITLSTHAVADISSMPSLQDWSHLVVQSSSSLTAGPLQLFLDGKKLTMLTDLSSVPNPFTWEIAADGSGVILPQQNIAILKHLRIYNREATEAEILADYQNSCLSPVGELAQYNGAGGPLAVWGRFNIPMPGTATTTGPGSITEYVNRFVAPDHQLPTTYAYNSLNQVIRQQSPDGGISEFWYDRLGRLVISQNAEQKQPAVVNTENPAGRYSYTSYDALGRITEVGEKIGASTVDEALVRQSSTLNTWMTTEGSKRQITVTAYDEAPAWTPSSLLGSQYYLRKRVSATALLSASPNAVNPAVNRLAASYYSYDIAGNVNELVQENTALRTTEAAHITGATGLKHIRYDYDLISGKVNKVLYQDGKWDQFYYLYEYDPENRLVRSLTNRLDQIVALGSWINEAHYRYYLHGPLARVELGKNFVQGVDYAYTLQGWLKGVNSQQLDMSKDMNGDGVQGSLLSSFARDVYGFGLGYYSGDYQAIGSGVAAFNLNYTAPLSGAVSGKPLYNGNISHATYALSELGGGNPSGYTYKYDQLNRLTAMNRHTINVPNWSNGDIIEDHGEEISYDANGNIKTYNRSGDHSLSGSTEHWDMDQLKYLYYYYDLDGQLRQYDKAMGLPADVARLTNQLAQVKDNVGAGNYTEDVDDQNEANYKYDRIGNLSSDEAEGLQSVTWTVYGKIASITKVKEGITTTISYGYDVGGNRISKRVQVDNDPAVETYYVRDAQGNVLGVYKSDGSQYGWEEQHLYGSSRLGIVKPEQRITTGQPLVNDTYNEDLNTLTHLVGKRVYELSNHLGNVLATISDKKTGVDNGSGGIDHYIAEVLSQNEYYPFGMGMPGRKYAVGGGYRYGFNGQEKSDEIDPNGNSMTAEYWQYDARLGRRWNIDPSVKEYESPYAAFANNPIWNIDPDGADTAKYLSNRQLVDALKIGTELVKSKVDAKIYNKYFGDDVTATLKEKSQAYWKAHQSEMNFGAYQEFESTVIGYHWAVANLAQWEGADEFSKLERSVINNKAVNNELTISLTVGRFREGEARWHAVWGLSMQAVGLVATAGLGGTTGGSPPKAPFSSNTQQAIVESKAGFNFTSTTIKRFTDPARAVPANDLRRAVGGTPYADPQGAVGASAYYTTILKNGKSYNLKVVYNQESNTIFHFHYSRSSMGPLPKIKK